MTAAPRFSRYVALGDSQTEGIGDPNPDGTDRGWADRFAERLNVHNPGLLYANLAVRGRRMAEIHDQQLAPAVALGPDLASVMGGVNDLIRPRFDLDGSLTHMDVMLRELERTGATVVTATLPDLSSFVPAARVIHRRVTAFNQGLRGIAADNNAVLADLARAPDAADPRLWSQDRLHLNPEGHRALAQAIAAAVLGTGDHEVRRTPQPVQFHHGTRQRMATELRWIRSFLMPWIGRRLTSRSSGDGRHPKRPQLVPVVR